MTELTDGGHRFGAMYLRLDLPTSDQLLDCSVCGNAAPFGVQFAYCGTVGNMCCRCLREWASIAWAQLHHGVNN